VAAVEGATVPWRWQGIGMDGGIKCHGQWGGLWWQRKAASQRHA
jgi:hypothetical protein